MPRHTICVCVCVCACFSMLPLRSTLRSAPAFASQQCRRRASRFPSCTCWPLRVHRAWGRVAGRGREEMKMWFTGTHERLHPSLAHLQALRTQVNCKAAASLFTGEYRTHPCMLRLSHARATCIIVSTPQFAHTNTSACFLSLLIFFLSSAKPLPPSSRPRRVHAHPPRALSTGAVTTTKR